MHCFVQVTTYVFLNPQNFFFHTHYSTFKSYVTCKCCSVEFYISEIYENCTVGKEYVSVCHTLMFFACIVFHVLVIIDLNACYLWLCIKWGQFQSSLMNKLSNSIDLSPWEASHCLSAQEFPNMLWNLKVCYHVNKLLPLISILSLINPVYTPQDSFCKYNKWFQNTCNSNWVTKAAETLLISLREPHWADMVQDLPQNFDIVTHVVKRPPFMRSIASSMVSTLPIILSSSKSVESSPHVHTLFLCDKI
jgi:hypothetical protein